MLKYLTIAPVLAILVILVSITLGTGNLQNWIQELPQGIYIGEANVVESELNNFGQRLKLKIASGHVVLANVVKYPVWVPEDQVMLKGEMRSANQEDKYEAGYVADGIHRVIEKAQLDLRNREENKHFSNLCHKFLGVQTYEFGNFLCGITIGEYNLAKTTSELFKSLGITHILSVSGYNVTVIMGVLAKLAGKFHRTLILKLSLVILLIYLQIVGADNIPAFRAVLMGCFVIIAQMSGRPGSIWLSLLYANTILFLLNPYLYLSISWQLSMSSLLGILLLTDRLNTKLIYVPGWCRNEFAVSLAASIATAPILMSNFGGISIIAPIANLIIAPVIPIFMAIGVIVLCLGTIVPPVPVFILQILEPFWSLLLQLLVVVNQARTLVMLSFISICILCYLYSIKYADKY